MNISTSTPRKKRLVFWYVVLAVLLMFFLAFSAYVLVRKPRLPFLPEKYYGTSWECKDPSASFDSDNEGYCTGILTLGDKVLPVEYGFFCGFNQHFGTVTFYTIEGQSYIQIFSGDYRIKGDRIVITGEWRASVEKHYHQTYDPSEVTMVFERKYAEDSPMH